MEGSALLVHVVDGADPDPVGQIGAVRGLGRVIAVGDWIDESPMRRYAMPSAIAPAISTPVVCAADRLDRGNAFDGAALSSVSKRLLAP